jgi:taurine dioxygenase
MSRVQAQLPDVRTLASGAALGAEIHGLQPGQLPTPEAVRLIERAVAAHGVILLRGFDCEEEAQLRLTQALGPPQVYPVQGLGADPPTLESRPEVLYVVHDPEADPGRDQIGNYTHQWHADGQFDADPPLYSILYAITVPESGGETQFASVTRAYRQLAAPDRLRLRLLRGEHVFRSKHESTTHPAVLRHPLSGNPCLYLSPGYTRRLLGPGPRRRALLRRVFRHMTEDRFLWTHRWRPGDLLIWDNFTTIHRRLPFDPGQRRVLRRSQAGVRSKGTR